MSAGLPQRHVAAMAILMFFCVSLTTFFVLRVQQPGYAQNRKFADIPLDHQVYSECKKLLLFDGVRLRNRDDFSPYLEITADELNQALLAAIRFNRAQLHSDMLIPENELNPQTVLNKFALLAELTGRQQYLSLIEKIAFNDLSRFNQLALVERVFMLGNHEE